MKNVSVIIPLYNNMPIVNDIEKKFCFCLSVLDKLFWWMMQVRMGRICI